MQVSVAMATYNGSCFLREQLDSIASQTELPAEIVISDDGSTDDTIAVAQDFGRSVPFAVKVLPPHERLGFADNFLNAAEHCSHELIMFADQDDAWLPRKLEDSRRRLVLDGSLLAMHTLTMAGPNLQPVGSFSQGIAGDRTFAPLELEPYLCGYGNTMMFRRELAHLVPRHLRPTTGERTLSHDTWIYTLAAALGKVSHLSASYILYRQHETNLTAIDNRTLFQRLIDLSTFQSEHYRQIMAFDHELARLLDNASPPNASWNDALQKAAKAYRQRALHLHHRLATYEQRSILRRISAFNAAHRPFSSRSELAKSAAKVAIKDLVVGVLRLGKKT